MFKRKVFSNRVILCMVYFLLKSKRVLAVFGLIAMIWASGPMHYLDVLANENNKEEIFFEYNNDSEVYNPDYPTTTDPDFDPSMVSIDSEVENERTLTSKTFKKIDGTFEMAMYDDIVHFEENGKLKDIDNSLIDNGTELENKENKFKVKFPKKLDDNKKIKLSMDEYSIDWSVLGINTSDISYDDTVVEPNNIKELTNINQSLIYNNIQPNIDIEYVITGSKVKENIILNEYVPNFSLSFEYKLSGLTLVENQEGDISFVNDEGEVVFILDDLYMFDSDNGHSNDVLFNYEVLGNKEYFVTVIPDDEWLKTAVYPVTVDPTVTINSLDSNINSKYTYGASGQNSTNSILAVGKTSNNLYRSYIEIGLDHLPENRSYMYAHLKMQTAGTSLYCATECQVEVREVDKDIIFSSISGSNDNNIDNSSDGSIDVLSKVIDYEIVKCI